MTVGVSMFDNDAVNFRNRSEIVSYSFLGSSTESAGKISPKTVTKRRRTVPVCSLQEAKRGTLCLPRF